MVKYTDDINFIQFWGFIASELGDSQCRLNARANRLQELFSSSSDHRPFLKDVIEKSYRRSKCKHLKDHIDLNIVLDVLGETAYLLKGAQADDLLDIELLEEICWLACQRYPNHIDIPEAANSEEHDKATVVSLPNVKIRIANNQL